MLFRTATAADIEPIVAMLADDELGQTRESAPPPLLPAYEQAFAAIEAAPGNDIWIADIDGEIAGFLQLTILPYLTYRGRPRALIEGVRVTAHRRGEGIGQRLIEHAVAQARRAGCHLVQLTSDRQRPEAIRFYEKLGFVSSHVGMKLHL